MKDSSYGARAKLGLIYPAPGWVMEPEFYQMSPEGVITCTTRISLEETSEKHLSKMGKQALEATKILREAPVDVIILGCTSGSFIGGAQYDLDIIKSMEVISGGVPCITTSRAAVDALNTLGLKKIAIATPYIKEVNEKCKSFFTESGFEVVNIKGLGLMHDAEIDSQSLETIYKLAQEVDTTEADGVAILCTGVRSIPILEKLEQELGKPVISAIQATFWKALRICGIKDELTKYGSLLRYM